MPESPQELYDRVLAATDADGRLALPDVAGWEIFPWDGEIGVRVLEPPAEEEPPREGTAAGAPCGRCADPMRNVIWENERWTVSSTGAPTGMPIVLFLMTKEHLDFTDMDDDLAGECGRISTWLARIVERMPGIGRCHVARYGDGAEHHHVWFFGRPAGFAQIRGSSVTEWDDILPPVPEDVWRADLTSVAEHLANHEGRALA